jgi:hypothetical protein
MLRKVLNIRGFAPDIMLRNDMAHLPVPTLFGWGSSGAMRELGLVAFQPRP